MYYTKREYHSNLNLSVRSVWVKGVDPDQTAPVCLNIRIITAIVSGV